MRRSIPCSRCSSWLARTAHRSWVGRSGQAWQGCRAARSSSRAASRCALASRRSVACFGGRTSRATRRAARSRRYRALRALPERGSGIFVRTIGGSSKSRTDSRKNFRSWASTVGRPSREDSTTASPRRLARGTKITSPGRSDIRASRTASDRTRSRPLRASSRICSAFSRSRQYSAKSPIWQCICSR